MSVIAAFTIIILIFALGDIISYKTKAFVPSVFVVAALFLAGYWTFFPIEIVDIPGLGMPVALLSMYFLLVHMGTLMSIRELVAQWRTVVVALSGIVGIVAFLFALGIPLFGRETVIVVTPPLAGGIVAALMMSEAATAKGLTQLGVLALVMYVMQGFVGYPLTALALKKEANRLVDLFRQGKVEVKSAADQGDAGGKSMLQIFPPTPEEYQTTFVMLAKIALLALLSVKLAELTGNALSPYVVCLLVGVIGAETGFIERRPLNIANSFGWLMLTLMAYVMAGLSSATPEMLMEILFPLAGSLIIGVIGMAILSMLVSRLVGYTKEIGFATALTALYGFPPNYILTMEAIKAVAENQEEREFLTNEMLPKMLVGGFTTVTIVSVILAGIFVGYM
ncbi:MAG: hypothetical protein WAQ41_10450 [bacterium]|nr:hypothetical protein [Bacillota bacterium]HHW55762.1 hypothetical protein [Bacillota bacterium]